MLHAMLVRQNAGKCVQSLNSTLKNATFPYHQQCIRFNSVLNFPRASPCAVLPSLRPQQCMAPFSTSVLRHQVDSDSNQQVPFTKNARNTEENETHGQPLHRFGSSDKLEQAAGRFDLHQYDGSQAMSTQHYQVDDASEHHADVYNHIPSVNLSACMQSQVPEPYGKTPTHMNMPGGVNRREHKYIQGRLLDMSGKREFSTAVQSHPRNKVDEHGNPTYRAEGVETMINEPCPQGIQGEDCEQFKLWLSNCLQHGDTEKCERLANEYIAGRKTLAQLFLEYDLEIQRVASSKQDAVPVGSQSPTMTFSSDTSTTTPHSTSTEDSEQKPLVGKPTKAGRLKAAVRDYGSTVIVFHVGISLVSLGGFYVLVASNVDMASILNYFNISLGSAQASIGTASTFAVAYAVHKVFAPVRIAITLTCAPFIVRALRARGILKAPKVVPPPTKP